MTAPDPQAIRDAADRAAEIEPVGVDYCTLHHGIRNEDDHRCDFADDDEADTEDGEPRPCELVPLIVATPELLSVLVPAARTAADLRDENKRLRELCGFLIDACATHRIDVPIHSSLLDLAADVAWPVTLPAAAAAARGGAPHVE